jgi:flagellar biosynthesis GTPase FlhF
MTLYFYAAVLAGALTVVTFVFSVILVPVWNWVSTVPGAVKSAATGMFTSNSPAPKPLVNNNRQIAATTPPAPIAVAPEKTPKPADCGRITKQLKAGKPTALPQECEQTYQVFREQEQARLEVQRQQEEVRTRELDRERAETENRQRIEYERERAAERERQAERQRQEAEQARAAGFERERLRQEAEDRRRQEARDESARRDAQRAAEERERNRQREQQKRNEAIIKLGTDIRKIFKRNN